MKLEGRVKDKLYLFQSSKLTDLIFNVSDFGSNYTDPALAPKGPKFILQQPNIIVVRTDSSISASIEYMATGIPLPSYSIIHTDGMGNTTEITASLDKRFTITNGKLTINNPMEAIDTGSYHCIAQNQHGLVVSNPMDLSFGCKFQIYFFIVKSELKYIVNISYQLHMVIKHIVNSKYPFAIKYDTNICCKYQLLIKYDTKICRKYQLPIKYGTKIYRKQQLPIKYDTNICSKYQLPINYDTNKCRKYQLPIRHDIKIYRKYQLGIKYNTKIYRMYQLLIKYDTKICRKYQLLIENGTKIQRKYQLSIKYDTKICR